MDEIHIIQGVIRLYIIDINLEVDRFMEKLKNNEYSVEKSSNSESDYTATKQQRDTDAVIAFTKSCLFSKILEMK